MPSSFSRVLEPIKIGKVEIKNRVAMAPMGIVGLLNPDSTLGQRAIDYYIERARGGVGLIITSLFKVENDIEHFKGTPLFVSPEAISSFAELAEAVHALGTKIFVQLTAGFGRVIHPRRISGQPISASAVPNYWKPELICRELETAEVEKLVKSFGTAARILASAGIDGIELHGHEGYLFDQFTTSVWNKRTDKYGGDLAGRLRFPIEVLNEIKEKVHRDFHVQYRFGLKHYIKGLNAGALPGENYIEAGRTVQEGLQMARLLEAAGFDSFHVDAGCYDSWYWAHPPSYQTHGCMADMAAEVKRVVNIPVIAVGRLNKPELAEKMLEEGKADMIALGRGLLSDAFWVRKVEQGQVEKIRPCIGDHDGCLGRIFLGRPISCSVNPMVGRERAYALKSADKHKKIIIVGGGIAGLEAARVAAIRGHQVTLCEKANVLGGHLIPAGVPNFKKDVQSLLEWYKLEIRDLGIDIKLKCEVTLGLINCEKADVLIIATGAKPVVPPIPGIEKELVVTAPEVLLGGKRIGEEVIVVGGGLIGCETAIWLAEQKRKVTIIEMLDDLMIGSIPIPHANRQMVLDMVNANNVAVMTGTRLMEVNDKGGHLISRDSKSTTLGADTIVLSVGLTPDRQLYETLVGETSNLYLIGDARETRNIMGAIWDAYEVAHSI
jgi:2-enoate reductase